MIERQDGTPIVASTPEEQEFLENVELVTSPDEEGFTVMEDGSAILGEEVEETGVGGFRQLSRINRRIRTEKNSL